MMRKRAKNPGATARPASSSVVVSHEQIAQRAYFRFLERGGTHGHDVDDWLAAERSLLEAALSAREGEPSSLAS